jgi:NADH-quinone oxidoreductase subunit K
LHTEGLPNGQTFSLFQVLMALASLSCRVLYIVASFLTQERSFKMELSLNHYLWLSAFMFTVGVVGVLVRRNAILIFMCIELMLNAVNLSLVAFSHFLVDIQGQMMVFFVMTVAAAEAAVGLAIVISLFRNRQTINMDEINLLKG